MPSTAPPLPRAAGPAAPHPRGQVSAWVRNTLVTYLPVVVMAVLAMLTYWLAHVTPLPQEPQPQRPLRHTADYFMHNFSIRSFGPKGELKSELMGTKGQHFEDTDVLAVDNPRVRAFDQDGHLLTATADHGLSNGDGSELQLMDNAVVVRDSYTDSSGRVQPRMEFHGNFLYVQVNVEKLSSNQPVTIIRGADRMTANQMDYDNLNRIADLKGRVHVTLAPRMPNNNAPTSRRQP